MSIEPPEDASPLVLGFLHGMIESEGQKLVKSGIVRQFEPVGFPRYPAQPFIRLKMVSGIYRISVEREGDNDQWGTDMTDISS